MASRYGSTQSPAMASTRSLGTYSMQSSYSNATNGMNSTGTPQYLGDMPLSSSSPQLITSAQHPMTPNGASGGHPVNGQAPRQPSGSRRPDKKDAKEVAFVHWRALKDFLATWIDKESPTARQSAREKLTRLTRLQFLELSTDVYDELMRRLSVERGSADNAAPFLPVRDDFHPKRNQARQKLATLPKNRFKDLASDVFFELRRRYPEFGGEEQQLAPMEKNEEPPNSVPMFPAPMPYRPQASASTSSLPRREGSGGGSAGSTPSHHRKGSSLAQSQTSNDDRGGTMETLANGSQHSERDRLANFTAATNDVVVPNKSRLQEEEIEVPYARDSTLDPALKITGSQPPTGSRDIRSDSGSSEHACVISTAESNVTSVQTDEPYFDNMSFAATSVRGKSMGMTSPTQGWEEQEKKLRADYELRVVALERRAQTAETERDDMRRQLAEAHEQRKDYEDEVRGLKERATTHASSLRSVQHELDNAREAANSQKTQASQQAQEEIQQWRERCEGLEDELRRLEDEKNDKSTRDARVPVDQSLVGELQNEVRSLVDELNSLSIRNDELVSERERDAETVCALEAKIEEYRRQASAARTELRNLKATSTLFVAQPLSNDHLPASADGNIADTHVTSFQQAIDGLLQAARSSHPSGVLPAMKAIVEAVTLIGEDVKTFEESPNIDLDASRLEQLKHESTTCLSGLMNAARNHAMASGLSPVSLIDAAAGHLSLNVVELIKLLKIRRSGKTREILNRRMSIGDMVRRGSNYGEDEKSAPQATRGDATVPSTSNNLSAAPPPSAYDYRINSFQSATSTAQRSDSFALEQNLQRQTSTASSEYENTRSAGVDGAADYLNRGASTTPLGRVGGGVSNTNHSDTTHSRGISLAASVTSGASSAQHLAYDQPYDRDRYQPYGQQIPRTTTSPPINVRAAAVGGNIAGTSGSAQGSEGSDREWEDLKPYLNTQSSSLVNAIQNLLAAIRTGGQGPALNEHLSEVIAISTSIVAVSSDALPPRLRAVGGPLLAEITSNTDRLSEAQTTAAHAGGFDKQLRQGIASASFGVAKALKALMKLGD